MEKDTVNINSEGLLLEYLYARLNEGITNGITEEDFFTLREALVKAINDDESQYASKATYKEESFMDIAERAINKTATPYNPKIMGLELIKGMIIPNYKLTLLDYNNYKSFPYYGRADKIKKQILQQFAKAPGLSTYSYQNISDNNFVLAKKIGAYYINNLIERYIDDRIESRGWPCQCRNADEYIFKEDIGKVINEKGTKNKFKIAYYQAIRSVVQLLENKQSSDENIYFSNDKHECLAYGNYIKMISSPLLSFLRGYDFDWYKVSGKGSIKVNVSASYDKAHYEVMKCTYYDPYEGDKGYSKEQGEIDTAVSTIMEKRIGRVLKKTL